MRRRDLILTCVGTALAWSQPVLAEQPATVRQLGFLGLTSLSEFGDRVDALREGLRQFGYIEGQSIAIHYRWAEGQYDRLPGLAAELVRLKVELILTHGTPGTRAAIAATATIPVVAVVVGDLLTPGLVPSLARPGGNLTGQTFFFAEVCAKRLELIKEAIPAAARVAVLVNPGNLSHPVALAAMKLRAEALRLELVPIEARTREEIVRAFDAIRRDGAHALVVLDDAFLTSNAEFISKLALTSHVPGIGEKSHATTGGLMAYAADQHQLWFRSAAFVDQILKGKKPADLPIQQATKFELVVNLKIARVLGVTIPATLLARADEVIE